MSHRARFTPGTELVVALSLPVQRRSDQTNVWLKSGDRLAVDSDFGSLIYGRILSGTKVAVAFVHGDLGRMTQADGQAIVPGGASTPKPPPPAPAPVPAAYQPPEPISRESGYLKSRELLNFWDMPR